MKVIFMTGNHTSRMRNLVPCAVILATLISSASLPAATYNPLWIPPMISGTTFNLSLNQTNRAFKPTGAKTVTYAFNSGDFWGPTLVMNKGDVVQMRVTNNLANTTTVHWHGFHIPAIMDGGPHQMIAPGTVWTPSFIIKNDAATYWYHPHLHGTSQEQLTKGAGGFIIVRDAQEAALPLPRTYGVDDLPVVFTSRRFLTNAYQGVTPGNQFAYDHHLDNYGDYLLANGVTNAQISLPAQFVRLRLLNAEIERGYNLGFSDNRIFHVIANDQGLLNAPVPVTRMFLMVGERVEILLNLSTNTVGSSLDLKAYNSGQVFGFPGQEGNPLPPNGSSGPINSSLLNNTGWTYHDMGNYDAALVKFEAALAFQQEHGDSEKVRIARWCIARTLRSLGRLDDALATQRELEKGKDDGYVWEEIAEILLAQGEIAESKPYFHRAHAELSQDPWLVANEAARIERLRDLGHE